MAIHRSGVALLTWDGELMIIDPDGTERLRVAPPELETARELGLLSYGLLVHWFAELEDIVFLASRT